MLFICLSFLQTCQNRAMQNFQGTPQREGLSEKKNWAIAREEQSHCRKTPFCRFGNGSSFLLLNKTSFSNGLHGEQQDYLCYNSLLPGSSCTEIVWPELSYHEEANSKSKCSILIWSREINELWTTIASWCQCMRNMRWYCQIDTTHSNFQTGDAEQTINFIHSHRKLNYSFRTPYFCTYLHSKCFHWFLCTPK